MARLSQTQKGRSALPRWPPAHRSDTDVYARNRHRPPRNQILSVTNAVAKIEALGDTSQAVHAAYATATFVVCSALDEYEATAVRKIVKMPKLATGLNTFALLLASLRTMRSGEGVGSDAALATEYF
jgi:hypothetical protein